MFITELQPLVKELLHQPLAFAGGFFSGLLRVKLTEDPLKSWLEKQGVTDFSSQDMERSNDNRPQTIAID